MDHRDTVRLDTSAFENAASDHDLGVIFDAQRGGDAPADVNDRAPW